MTELNIIKLTDEYVIDLTILIWDKKDKKLEKIYWKFIKYKNLEEYEIHKIINIYLDKV